MSISRIPFVERRSSARLRETPLRRRSSQVRYARQSGDSTITPHAAERRKSSAAGFDAAATLELNLDRYPSKVSMATFLNNLLYSAEAGDFAIRQPGYLDAIRQAVDVVEQAPATLEAVATLQGYQAYMASRDDRLH